MTPPPQGHIVGNVTPAQAQTSTTTTTAAAAAAAAEQASNATHQQRAPVVFERNPAQGIRTVNHMEGNTHAELPAWRESEPPKGELMSPRMHDGKARYYCHKKTGGLCGGVCRAHKPSACRGLSKKDPPKPDKRSLKLANAMESVAQRHDDSSDSE